MVEFYRDLSKHYEIIFPLNSDKLDFVKKHLKTGTLVLDIGCGTGELVMALEKDGYRAAGMDLSGEMIAKAKEEAKGKMLHSEFQVGDMRAIGTLYHQPFDGIFCFGNTIVHLNLSEEIGDFFTQVYHLLKPGGTFFFQIVNYDRVITQEVKELPLIKNEEEGLVFYRNYDYDVKSGLIAFRTRLVINGEEEIKHEVMLYPLRSKEAEHLLQEAGFAGVKFFGSFTEASYEPEKSQALVVVARKE